MNLDFHCHRFDWAGGPAGIGPGVGDLAQRAEAIGLRYNVATRIDGYNISQGRAISIAIFRSEGTE